MTTVTISLLSTAFIFLVSILITGLIGARPNGDILLGVSLPNYVLEDEEVTGLVKKFKRAYWLRALICTLLILPIIFIGEYAATLYLLFWCCITLYLLLGISAKYFSHLHTLKVENKWQVGAQNIIVIDTEVSRQKNTFMLSQKWFLIPLALTVALSIIEATQDSLLAFGPIFGLGMLVLFYLVFRLIGKVKTKIYSQDTEINLHLNHVFKQEWSRCMIILAVLSCLFTVSFSYLAGVYDNTAVHVVTTMHIIAFVFVAANFAVIIAAHRNIMIQRNQYLPAVQEMINRDDDQYWIGGIIYNNPSDSSIFVEKRIGMGFTINIGSYGGKLFLVGSFLAVIGTILVILWLT